MAKEASSREDDIKREFNFATHSIISHVLRGVLVGIFAGLLVGVFRFLIEYRMSTIGVSSLCFVYWL